MYFIADRDFIRLKKWFREPSTNRKISILLIILSFIASIFTFLTFTNSLPYIKTTPKVALFVLFIDFFLLVFLCFKVIRKIFLTLAARKKGQLGSKISTKFILTFALLVLIPTITLATFSSLFFNAGMKAWFNDRILKISEQSNVIAKAYLEEHKQNIKNDVKAISKEIDEQFNMVFLNLNELKSFVDKQIKIRELTEAFIFKRGGIVLVKGGFTISTTPDLITEFELMEAEKGDVILTSKRKDRVRALIKLNNLQNTFLSIGKFVDPQIISQIESIQEESLIYKNLFDKRKQIEINFYMVFILISLLILLISILIGLLFADALISPISNLIKTSNEIKQGNLAAKVPRISSKDEMSLLIKTFNEMTNKLKIQRTELQKRERNAAWSDIARRIAHEIKNPLTPIQLSAEYLLSKSKNKNSKIYANTILKKVTLIEKMVDEFSQFARLPKPNFKRNNLTEICKELFLFHKNSNNKINFSYKNNNKDIFLKIDELQISMAITNLFKNSIESINEISKQKKNKGKISLILSKNTNKTIIRINDSGKGLPKNFSKNKILEPYITTKKTGSGLGLPIVLKIVQEHDGNFFLENYKNGTSAIIELSNNI